MFVPLLLFPFSAILFYALGGGGDDQNQEPVAKGINTDLPSPSEQDGSLNKLSMYEKAAADSAKARQQENSSLLGFFSVNKTADTTETLPAGAVESPFSPGSINYGPSEYGAESPSQKSNRQLAEMEQKLARIQRTIDEQPPAPMPASTAGTGPDPAVTDLEHMMASLQQAPSGDPELAQMSGMLQSILDIQHPDRVRERIKQQSIANAAAAYPVTTIPRKATTEYFGGLISAADSAHSKGKILKKKPSVFYDDLHSSKDITPDHHRAIEAVVHEQQSLVTGATVKIRLLQPVYVDGRLIPEGTFLFGTCQLSGERLAIDIASIRAGSSLYPVKLSVFDLDGNLGIRIPGSINREVSKESADQAIQAAAIGTLDPSLGAQAASAGIETARRMLSKKIKLIRVTIGSDYPILLANQ